MLTNLTPSSVIERAFAQAAGWETGKLWSEIERSKQKGHREQYLAQLFCMAYRLALVSKPQHLNTITNAMVWHVDKLTEQQKYNLLSVGMCVLESCIEEGMDANTNECRLLLRVICQLMLGVAHRDINFLCSFNKLKALLDIDLDMEELKKLDLLCNDTSNRVSLLSTYDLGETLQTPLQGEIPTAPKRPRALGHDPLIVHYLETILQMIEARWKVCSPFPTCFPEVTFRLNDDASIATIELRRQSGSAEVDEDALSAITRSVFPFPFFSERIVNMQITVSFAPEGPFIYYEP